MNATKATEKLRAIAKAAISRATNKSIEASTTTSSSTTESTTTAPLATTATEAEKVVKEEKIVQEADEESEEEAEEEEEATEAEETPEVDETSTATTDPVVFKQAPIRIPEAEEEEIPTKDQEHVEVSFQETGTTSTTRAPLSGQTVYNLNANANSASDPAISNVFTPVNAIVDGIGPLILPLIGYSRQALQYYPRAQGANTYQPDNSGKPVQLRSLPKGYGFGGGQEQQQQASSAAANYARGTPIQQQQTLSSLKTATTDQLIEAFHRASKANNLATSPPRPYSRYVPNPSSVNSYYTQGNSQQNLEQLRKAFVQSNQPEYNLKQPQEIFGTTLATEPTYYGPQIDRHIGQNLFTQGVRHREETPKSPLPIEENPDPAYAEGLKKVTAFVGDSGVMTGDENAAEALQESGLPPVRKSSNGFGGGHGPNASFDEVVKNTEQEPSYSFLG
uniref:Uncharacterized protein n=1 Tax=Panagrolaimus superbus TaxID=310955 RepID=A0A914YEW6_9BILA